MSDLLLDRVVAAIGDRYDVEGELGRGGMAVVYRARDVRLRRPVALKVLPPDLAFRDGVRARFLREAETAAGLSHPNIVPVYAADETGGVAWLAMALVAGETVGARMARAPRLPVDEARRILAEVADALAYAHARGVVHRDIKPDNILLDQDTGRAVVTDFGIARAAEADERLTLTGIVVGTPTYMSPEQALGEHEVDGRSDLYSLGVVGYQMLAGVPPFSATSAAALLMKHVGERARPLGELRPDVPVALAAAIDRVLAKKPDDRWADAASFRQALLVEPRSRTPNESRGDAPSRAPNAVPRSPTDARPAQPAASAPNSYPTAPLDVRAQRDEWKERLREQRHEWRERQREQREMWKDSWRDSWRGNLPAPVPERPAAAAWMPTTERGGASAMPLERGARAFRRRALMMLALLGLLAFINLGSAAASGMPFPWVVFPAFGILSGLRRRWRPLAREGLSLADVMFDGGNAGATRAARRASERRPAELARRLRGRITLTVVAAFASALSFVIGASLHAHPMIVPFVGFMLIALYGMQSTMFAAAGLRRSGVSVRQALSASWEQTVALADPRSRDAIAYDDLARLVSADVLAGPHGHAVRGAVDDRLVVRETLAKLPAADRALLPRDVLSTIDELVDKVASLAQSLHRLDVDVSPAQLDQIDARLQAAEREPAGAPDRERKLQLLERQRTSLTELFARRDTLAAQMESAQLVLQNIKLDLIKLRSSGVGAGLGDLSAVTQEARSLSRDIKYALDAVAEVRGT